MSISSIIIDNNKTKAKRIASDKIQLDLVAMPLDKENDMEPNVELRFYVNHELLQNLRSDVDGYVKESLVITNEEGESITVRLEDLKQEVKSKIKCLMIEKGESQSETRKETVKKEISPEEKKQEIINFVSERGWNLSDERCKDYINDFDVVMAAVKQNGLVIQFASGNMKVNYDIVMEAVKINGLALQYAHPSFKEIDSICLDAVISNPLIYNFLPKHICLEESILEAIFMAASKDISIFDKLYKLSKDTKREFEVIIKRYNGNDPYLNTKHLFIKNNKDYVLYLISNSIASQINGLDREIPDNLRNNKEFKNGLLAICKDLEKKIKQHPYYTYITDSIAAIKNIIKENKYD